MHALTLGVVFLASSLGAAPTNPPAQAREFLSRFGAFQQATATPADVERFLELCTDGLAYEHPRVGAVIRGKGEVRKGLLAHLGETRADRTRLIDWVEGPNVLVLHIDRAFEVRDGEAWKPVQRGSVFVLETEPSGRIRRILDYW
jgi:hypothetical protein